jgi:nucleoid DNA-binding protein
MNRGQLVEQIAKANNLSKRAADTILSSVIETIQKGVKKDGEVRLVGFGTFKKVVRKARKGVNPKTGEKIKIARKTLPKFVPSKTWNPTQAVAAKKRTVKKTTK